MNLKEKMRDARLGTWLSIAAIALPLIVGAAGIWWYLQSDELRNQQWYADDQRWNTGILTDLADIKAQIAMTESDIVKAIDRHEEFVSGEHRDGGTALLQGQAGISQSLTGAIYQMGVHQGQHSRCE